MTEDILPDDLVPGKKYRATFSDCCVGGEFTATFQSVEWLDDDRRVLDAVVFDSARIRSLGNTRFYEVEEDA